MTARRARPVLALAAILAVGGLARAAEAEVQLWTEAGVGTGLAGDVSAYVEQNIRFDEDVTRLTAVIPEIGVEYEPWWWLRVDGAYRYSYERRRRGDLEFRHRAHADVQARHDLGEWRLRHRVRFQNRYRGRDGHTPAVRNRAGLGLRALEPWVPRVTAETWHRLGVERDEDVGGGTRAFHFHKWRLEARVRYDFDPQAIAALYRLEVSRTHPGDPPFHIFGLSYFYEL